MRRRDFDWSQRFCIQPNISVTEAESADAANFAVDDGEFELSIERRRFDVLPSRSVEKPE